jgi:hypothetical protein
LNFRESYLELTQAAFLLLEEEPLVLASPEDAAFFRRSFQKKKESPEEPLPLFCPLPSKPKPKKQLPEPAAASCEPLPPPPEKRSPISPSFSFSTFSSLFANIAPNLLLLKEIPDDTLAKNIAHRWKTRNKSAPITLLTFSESAPHQKLLQEIIKAIDVQFYKEIPSQGIRTLGKIPLFLLPDLSLYLKDPLLKRSLWKALCQKIS